MTGPLTRRRALQFTSTATLGALAGCTSSILGSSNDQPEYALNVESIDFSPVEYALYEPDDGALFGQPARTALENILPTGRYTTYGYTPLQEDLYVDHQSKYYQTEYITTGRKEIERTLVRANPVNEANIPENAILIDSLDRPSARVLKILASHARTDGQASPELLRGDAYVLRRPAERDSKLAMGDLNDRVVKMDESGAWAYRPNLTREKIIEPAHTVFAVRVADSRQQFREVVFGSRIDTELDPENMSSDVQQLLEQAIGRGTYRESGSPSEAFNELLSLLHLNTSESVNGQQLWYGGEYYRYSLYINDSS
jgi:hypothetical protein